MATKKIYDLAVVVGTYQTQQGTKNRYQQVGAIMEKDDGGKFIMLERWFNPAGVPNPENRSNLLLSMFPPKDESGGQQQQRPARNNASNNYGSTRGDLPDDDIPF